jgi:hypothetical protein
MHEISLLLSGFYTHLVNKKNAYDNSIALKKTLIIKVDNKIDRPIQFIGLRFYYRMDYKVTENMLSVIFYRIIL